MLIVSLNSLSDYTPSLKTQGAGAIELRLDLFPPSDIQALLEYPIIFHLPVILTLKPGFSHKDFKKLAQKLKPEYIDLDYTFFNAHALILQKELPYCKLIVSKHSPHLYELTRFYKKHPLAHIKKLVIETENTCLGLKIALKAQKEGLILFAAGKNTPFTRFFSAWHYCYVSRPTGPGQIAFKILKATYAKTFGVCAFYALIGNPIDHSLSHITHNALLQNNSSVAIYLKIAIASHKLSESIKYLTQLGALGLSITTPLKQAPYFRKKYKQGINTLDLMNKKAFNTDTLAVLSLLQPYKAPHVLLIGKGAVAKSFIEAFKKMGIKFTLLLRNQPVNFDKKYDILINATSSEDPLMRLPNSALLINLYHHTNSPLIEQKAKALGTSVISGRQFFYLQAMEQFMIWFKNFKPPSEEAFFSLVKEPSLELISI